MDSRGNCRVIHEHLSQLNVIVEEARGNARDAVEANRATP